MSSENFELIYSYSHKQAIEDGMLIDVSEQAKDSGFVRKRRIGDNEVVGS
jgi:hypothetical protein